MLSLAKPQQLYQIILSQGFGLGIGVGMLYLPGLAVIAHHFAKYRTVAMGIVMTGSSCGGVMFPIMIK